ncbi:MAG TPA: pitrilysin family protein, partial [Polyangiales bacterium]|nr:pitrilysin family protein [Polyangiales bacterium]
IATLLASVLLLAGASCSDDLTETKTESDGGASSVDGQTIGSKTTDKSGNNKEDVEDETSDSERAGSDDEKKRDDAAKPSAKDAEAKSDEETKLDNPDVPVDLPAGFKYRVLSNGLEVYSARDTSTANVSVQVWYKVGSKDDPAGRSGFAHLFEHLMFKATRNLPSETIDRLTEDVGGSNNAFTADDTTAYYEIVPANHLERVLFAEAERLGSLVVDDAVFKAERDVVKEELRQRVLASPYGRLFSLYVPQEAYQEHPYRRPGIGSLTDLDAAQIGDVLAFHETFYRPDNAYLIVVGNFEEPELNGWVDKYFGPIERPDRALPVNNVQEPARTAARDTTYYVPNVSLPAVLVNWLVPKYASDDAAALSVLDGILSTGQSSRLYRALVYEQQNAAEIGTSLDQAQQAGNFSAYALMATGHTVEEGKTALLAEVKKLRDEKVSAEELEEAKNELIAARLRNAESLIGRANEIGESLIMTGNAAWSEKQLENIRKVTVDDVQRVAQTYLTEQSYVVLNYIADTEKPADAPAEPRMPATDAPITLDMLAPAGEPVTLAPEAERIKMPGAGPERDVTTPAVSEQRLANGVRVIVVPRHNLPLVNALLSFNVGSSADPAGKAGVASLAAALLTEGTSMKTSPQIATQIESLGAQLTATVNNDFTQLSVNSPSEVFEGSAALLSELVHDAAFPETELTRLKAQALDSLAISLNDPASIADMASGRVIFGDAPYGTVLNGTPTSIPNITRGDVVDLYRTRWVPGSATLVFSGDIEPAAGYALAQKLFADLKDPEDAAPAVEMPAGEPAQPRVVVIDQPGAGQAAVEAVSRSIPRNDADYYPLLLSNAVLGGGYSARLNAEIRVKRGLSYGASSRLGERVDAGLFSASAQTRNDAAAQVVQLMAAEITRLSTDLVTSEELAPRRATVLGSFSRSLETVSRLGSVVGGLAQYGLPVEELSQYATKVRAVTPEQMRDAVQRRLPAAAVSYIVVGEADQFAAELMQAYPSLERIPLTELNLDTAALR